MKTILSLAAVCSFTVTAVAQQAPIDPVDNFGVAPLHVTNLNPRATTGCDDFNRAALGADWAAVAGTPTIVNDRFAGSGNTSAQNTLASLSYDGAVISFDLPDAPTGLTYGAAVHGLGGTDNLFTKVQSNGGGGVYDFVGFYHLAGSSGGGLGGFQAIPTPITGGIVTFHITGAGDTMNIDMDTDRDGVVDQTMSAGGCLGLAPLMGTGVGLGCYGDNAGLGAADDWELNDGCGGPSGPTLTLTCGSGTATADMANCTPGGMVAVVYGSAGSYTHMAGACAGTVIDLIPSNLPALITTADAAGDASVSRPVGALICGSGILVQAVDGGTCAKTNAAAL